MSNDPKRVMVAGATGYIGGGVARALHRHGLWVRGLSRDAKRLADADFCDDVFVGQATDRQTIQGLCDGCDVAFSSVGIHSFDRKPTLWEVDYQANMNILEEAKRAGVKHFVFVSVIKGPEMAALSPIAGAREKVAQAIIDSGMNYTIYRPTGFYNDMQEFLRAVQKKGKIRLFGDGTGIINPISSLDFGDAVAKAINDPSQSRATGPIGGPETFTHRQVADLAFEVVGKEPRVGNIPPWQIGLIATCMRPFNYNLYSLFKFFEFIARTHDMTGEPVGSCE
ncbi:MAG: SDR family oxidoreductase, partial [Polyangiaceae bacterium]|nr:SDR family oxidoreductase [Polyangiaceae bacterium]